MLVSWTSRSSRPVRYPPRLRAVSTSGTKYLARLLQFVAVRPLYSRPCFRRQFGLPVLLKGIDVLREGLPEGPPVKENLGNDLGASRREGRCRA